jgi:hypothetical protein
MHNMSEAQGTTVATSRVIEVTDFLRLNALWTMLDRHVEGVKRRSLVTAPLARTCRPSSMKRQSMPGFSFTEVMLTVSGYLKPCFQISTKCTQQ